MVSALYVEAILVHLLLVGGQLKSLGLYLVSVVLKYLLDGTMIVVEEVGGGERERNAWSTLVPDQ